MCFSKTISLSTLFIILTISSFGQKNRIYSDVKRASRTPLEVIRLDLQMVHLKKSDFKKIAKFNNLETLDISVAGLKKFPKELLALKNIKSLNISNNDLESIPKEILQLTSLEELVLGGNRLLELPTEVFLLENLKDLDLIDSKVKMELPIELLDMKSLESLHCNSTVKEFEEIICKMTWLTCIEVFCEKAISPCLLDSLPHIEKFKMTIRMGEKFQPFECSLKGNKKLKEVDIHYYSCCWPYIQADKEEVERIKTLLPDGCVLKGFRDQGGTIKSDIELR
ncbi:MAG: hypothetical protein ACI857_000488 [Arenicella sp.]|jgi:hypothetical protein